MFAVYSFFRYFRTEHHDLVFSDIMHDEKLLQDLHVKTFRSRTCMKSITDLPDELLVRIFEYLHPVFDRLPLLGIVCKKWREILHEHGSLWRIFHVDPLPCMRRHYDIISSIFRVYGYHIQKLTWRESSPVYESVFTLIARLGNLRSLRLPILWTRSVVKTLASLSQLEQVQINGGFALSDDDLFQIGCHFRNLKEVSLNACWRITFYGINNFINQLRHIEILKLKINSGLRLNDPRSANAMVRGREIVQGILDSTAPFLQCIRTLCLHFVPLNMEHLWSAVQKLKNLKKLNISNCQDLYGIRLLSDSLQTICLFNIWNTAFVSICSSSLRFLNIDHGLESMEHLEVDAPNLRRATIDGNSVLLTIRIASNRMTVLELAHCEEIDISTFCDTLRNNPSIMCLRLGSIAEDSLLLTEYLVPRLQELCLLGDFSCETLHVRSPTLRLLHAEAENDLVTLNHLYITANHLCKVALMRMPALKTLTIQCVSVDAIEMNLCSDDQLILDSCIIHALNAIGFLRLFDCRVNLLSVTTPLAQTVVFYRCHVPEYALQMALNGCHNIMSLNLEKCRDFRDIIIQAPPLKFLNLFGCTDIRNLNLVHFPQLIALNIGQCPNVRILIRGVEYDMAEICRYLQIVSPESKVRWSHEYPPQSYLCA